MDLYHLNNGSYVDYQTLRHGKQFTISQNIVKQLGPVIFPAKHNFTKSHTNISLLEKRVVLSEVSNHNNAALFSEQSELCIMSNHFLVWPL